MTDGDHTQSIEDSGSLTSDINNSSDNKNGDDNYIAGMKKGNSNIMVRIPNDK